MEWLIASGTQTDQGHPGPPDPREKAEPQLLLLPLSSLFQKQLDLLLSNHNEWVKDNGDFLNACLETTVSSAQIKIAIRLETKEPLHCAGAALRRCLVLSCDRQCMEPALPMVFCFRRRLNIPQTSLRSSETRKTFCRVVVCYSTKQNLSERRLRQVHARLI